MSLAQNIGQMRAELLDERGLTPAQNVFLDAYPKYRTITATADAIGISRQTVHDWSTESPPGSPFGDAFLRSKLAVGDEVEGEMLRRALAGKSSMSDTLLIFATKRFKPEYRENYTVTHAGTVTNLHVVAELTSEDRSQLLAMALEHEQRLSLPPDGSSSDG